MNEKILFIKKRKIRKEHINKLICISFEVFIYTLNYELQISNKCDIEHSLLILLGKTPNALSNLESKLFNELVEESKNCEQRFINAMFNYGWFLDVKYWDILILLKLLNYLESKEANTIEEAVAIYEKFCKK